jgi:sugar lactone lactonase YvrE
MDELTPGVELVVDTRSIVGEGPFWQAEKGVLGWVDIMSNRLHTYDPATGRDTTVDVGQPIGAASARASGGYVLALRDGFAALDDAGKLEMLAHVELDLTTNRMNDGNCDRLGRFWAGTMAFDELLEAGALYCLDLDHSVRRVFGPTTISNGIDWSPDDQIMYYVDSTTQGLDTFPFNLDAGTLGPRQRLATIPRELGVPDGLTVDADGYIWVAVWGGWCIRRYTPEGALDRVITLPVSQVSACAFGGPNLDDLYITSASANLSAEQLAREPLAGSLFRFRPGVRGKPRFPYRG